MARRFSGIWLGLVGLGLAACQPSSPTPPALIPAVGDQIATAIRAADAPVVLLNLWATWCVPCREEFPDLIKLEQQYRDRGLKVVLVSWDLDPAVAQKFLAAHGVDFPSYIKSDDQNDQAFMETLEPKWTGAFPATFIYDATGQLRQHWEGKRSYTDFETAVLAVLNPEP